MLVARGVNPEVLPRLTTSFRAAVYHALLAEQVVPDLLEDRRLTEFDPRDKPVEPSPTAIIAAKAAARERVRAYERLLMPADDDDG